MAEPETEKKKKTSSSSIILDTSLLSDSVSKLQLSPSLKPDWSLLPEELLQLISTHLAKSSCFVDSIHARSVCTSWRSTFPFPSSLLPKSYDLPSDNEYPIRDSCTIEKFPLFLFRLKPQTPDSPSEYFLGGIALEDHHTELLSPLQCSVKANFPVYNPILMNVLDCQILPLGHHFRLIGLGNRKRLVALLPLNNEEEDEFVVLLNYARLLLVYKSSEMRWTEVMRITSSSCKDIFTFRGKFYAHCLNRDIHVVDPYNPLTTTFLMPPEDLNSWNYLVPSSDDEELFLVERNIETCRVSKLDEETSEWIVISDLRDRVLIIGQLGNVAFSVKEFPDGCGLSRNSILFLDRYDGNVTFAYKYDDLGFWRISREDRVLIRNESLPVLAFRVDRVRNKVVVSNTTLLYNFIVEHLMKLV